MRGTRAGLPGGAAGVLVGVSGLLALVFAGLAVGHAWFDNAHRAVMAPLSAVLAIAMAGIATTVAKREIAAGWEQPLAALVLLGAGSHPAVHMLVTRDPAYGATLLVTVVGAGAWLRAPRWLAATDGVLVAGWAVCAVFVGARAGWAQQVLALVAAVALAGTVFRARAQADADLAGARALADAIAVTDPLTGLPNQRGLPMLGRPMLELARRQGDALHCLVVEVDGLPTLRECFGREAVEAAIVRVADALRIATRGTDAVARWGEAEFRVVGPGPGMPVAELERRLRQRLGGHPAGSSRRPRLQVSVGAAMLAPWDEGNLDTLLAAAARDVETHRSPYPRPGRTPSDDRGVLRPE